MTPDDWRVKLHSVDNELLDKFEQIDTLEREQKFAVKYFYILYQKLRVREKSINFLFKWIRGLEDYNNDLKLQFREALRKLNNEELELFNITKRLNRLNLE